MEKDLKFTMFKLDKIVSGNTLLFLLMELEPELIHILLY